MIPHSRDQLKSDEEFSMLLWLQEATKHDLVESWDYESRSFVLFERQTYVEEVLMKTKSKQVERVLHQQEKYTPDFFMKLTETGKRMLYDAFKPSLLASHSGAIGEVWIDVKGAYNLHDQPRYFSSTRKAMYNVHRIWVAKVIPFASAKSGLFVETFAPESLRYMKNKTELNRIGRACMNVKQFIEMKEK